MKPAYIIFVAFLIFSEQFLFAQNMRVQLPPGYNKIVETSDIVPGREGSPYLSEDWQPGTLILTNGNIIKGLYYKYDVFKNEMLYQYNKETYAIGAPDSIKELTLPGGTFIYKDFSSSETPDEKGFYQIIEKGTVDLLVKYEIETIRANYNVALNSGSKNDKLILKEKYYLLKGNKIQWIDKKGKNVWNLLADKKNEVSDYVSKMNISFKNKDDLTKVVSFYNKLEQ